jgi:raffinose/stachyose/melibiose transport system substrate-binding protein
VAKDGISFYPDWPAAGYYNVLVAASQDLTNGIQDGRVSTSRIAAKYNAGKP